MKISRKTIGQGIRYAIASIFFIPVSVIAILGMAVELENKLLTVILDRFKRLAEMINVRLNKWEMNSPEGTMERLKKDFKNED